METIEVIGITTGAVATVLGGVWFIISRAMSFGETKAILKETAEIAKQHTTTIKELEAAQVQRDSKVDVLQQDHGHLECVKDTKYSDRVKKSVAISESNNEMLRIIAAWVMKQDGSIIEEVSKKFSPRRMTALGEKIYEESKAKEVLEANIDFFVEKLREINPQTAYDVEQKSLEVILPNLALDMFIPIKTYLYNAPSYVTQIDTETNEEKKASVNMQSVVFIMSLNLRDEYLKRYADDIKG